MIETAQAGILQKEFLSQTLILLPQKAIYWQETKTLLVADVHFGKIGHFRKAGIPLPMLAIHQNINNLSSLCAAFDVAKIIFLGDLFHSGYNHEWEIFTDWRKKISHISVELIRGNHDIIANKHYAEADITVFEDQKIMPPFLLCHHPPQQKTDSAYYVLAGHLHPAVMLSGAGKQNLRLPCFHFGKSCAVLPAFGSFTGFSTIKPKAGDGVYVIASQKVLKLPTGA